MMKEIQEIVVGNKERFALTCEVCLENPSEGNVFIYMNNKKFGNNNYSYELDFFLWHAQGEFSETEFVYPAFFSMTALEMISGISELYAENPEYSRCKFEEIFPGFIKSFEESEEVAYDGINAEDVIDEIKMFGGNYGFNHITIVLLSDGKMAKLFIGPNIQTDNTREKLSDFSEECEAIQLEIGEFSSAFKLLYQSYSDNWGKYAVRFQS
ncbi:MAG: hypothetical protein ACRBEE_15735 [Arenicella sp.]